MLRRVKALIPPALHFKLVNLKHRFCKFKVVHYSQNGEDIVLNNMFANKSTGFYVDIGAHHPYRISNTYLLYKRGWRGMNIDANPETIAMFKRARSQDTNINVGVGLEVATLPYHQFSDPAVNTFSDTDAEVWKKKRFLTYLGTTPVTIKPLAAILSESLPPNTTIDVMSVDVEGFDLQVLESNDWNKFRPTVLIVEDHTFTFATKDTNPIFQFLARNGYELENKLEFSLFFRDTRTQ